MTDLRALLARTADHVAAYREAAAEAAVFPEVDLDAVRAAIGGRLPDGPAPAGEVVDQLAAAVEPAMVATTGPRYFGFVVGGALDAATAADVLAVGWDQPAYNHALVAGGRGRRGGRRRLARRSFSVCPATRRSGS